MRRVLIIMLGIGLLAPPCRAADEPAPADRQTRESYSLGYEFGNNIRKQGVDVNLDALLSGVRESLAGKTPALTPAEMDDTLKQLRNRLLIIQSRRVEAQAAKSLKEGQAFLEQNRTRPGVVTLPSGLQYQVLHEGTGPRPRLTDTVQVRYRGTFVDGTEFDNTFTRAEPVTVRANGVMRGWTEALQLMPVGSKWRLFIPSELAYGERSFGRIPANSTLIFEVELIAIQGRK